MRGPKMMIPDHLKAAVDQVTKHGSSLSRIQRFCQSLSDGCSIRCIVRQINQWLSLSDIYICGLQVLKSFFKIRSANSIGQSPDVMFWMEGTFKCRVKSWGLFWDHFFDPFYKVRTPYTHFLADLKTNVGLG